MTTKSTSQELPARYICALLSQFTFDLDRRLGERFTKTNGIEGEGMGSSFPMSMDEDDQEEKDDEEDEYISGTCASSSTNYRETNSSLRHHQFCSGSIRQKNMEVKAFNRKAINL